MGWVSPDREQKYLYMMNGGTEQVHVLDHVSGKILSSFGRPGHQLGNFTHGHTLAVDSKGNSMSRRPTGPAHTEVQTGGLKPSLLFPKKKTSSSSVGTSEKCQRTKPLAR